GDMGRADVEGKLRQSPGQLEQQAGTIEPGHLDHGVAARPAIVDVYLGQQCESIEPRPRGFPFGHDLRQLEVAAQGLFDRIGHACGPASFVGVEVELTRDGDGVGRAALGGGEDLRVDDVGAGNRARAGDDREQQGWSGASTVSSVTPRAAANETEVASDFSAWAAERKNCAWASLCGRSTLSQ